MTAGRAVPPGEDGADLAAGYIARWRPSSVSPQAASFARDVIGQVAPQGKERAKNLLWAAARLADYAIPLGLDPAPEVLLHPSVIERFAATAPGLSGVARRTLRTNLRFLARRVVFSVVHGVHEGAGQRVRQRAELAPSGGCRTGLAWSGWRGGGQSVAAAASSAMAVRAEDSSAMVLPAVQAASSAVVARRLMARGMPRAQEWMTRTASSENRVSLRPAWVRWARRYPSASAAVIAGEGMTQRSWTL